jgi:hypothetical protein
MSALGQKRTFQQVPVMSALPPKADITERDRDVGFVPKADSCTAAKRPLAGLSFGAFLPHKFAAVLEAPGQPESNAIRVPIWGLLVQLF